MDEKENTTKAKEVKAEAFKLKKNQIILECSDTLGLRIVGENGEASPPFMGFASELARLSAQGDKVAHQTLNALLGRIDYKKGVQIGGWTQVSSGQYGELRNLAEMEKSTEKLGSVTYKQKS
tara:strand:- start:314 stop:679 length:366 start_codon:yes stop_codon:yes gene_type:complete